MCMWRVSTAGRISVVSLSGGKSRCVHLPFLSDPLRWEAPRSARGLTLFGIGSRFGRIPVAGQDVLLEPPGLFGG
jgi:hypothetical protein